MSSHAKEHVAKNMIGTQVMLKAAGCDRVARGDRAAQWR
jgi:hypothetical protein